jgi:hypothetical protein
MPESETIFDSKVSYNGVFSFKNFYKFCYEWLVDDGYVVEETEYNEKIAGAVKDVVIKWKGKRKITDYFLFEISIEFRIIGMSEVEAQQGEIKIKTNKGGLLLKIRGNLVRDYEGKWEKTAFQKFLRGIYEKYVIPSRVLEYKGKINETLTEFSEQTKAFLELEGKR